ncbi:MAG: hypothetical protein ACI9C2_000896, partial [Gammaproteobacteria bacterium]
FFGGVVFLGASLGWGCWAAGVSSSRGVKRFGRVSCGDDSSVQGDLIPLHPPTRRDAYWGATIFWGEGTKSVLLLCLAGLERASPGDSWGSPFLGRSLGTLGGYLAPFEAPLTLPKAQLSASMVISIFVLLGTLTATGAKPTPQQFPGKTALTRTLLVPASLMAKFGDDPRGMKLLYCSPALP